MRRKLVKKWGQDWYQDMDEKEWNIKKQRMMVCRKDIHTE